MQSLAREQPNALHGILMNAGIRRLSVSFTGKYLFGGDLPLHLFFQQEALPPQETVLKCHSEAIAEESL
jgi:hypothetical protein